MDIVVWLRSLGLGKYEAVFRENEIDDTILPNLTVEDLKELGVTALGHRRKLLDAIAALRTDASAKTPSMAAATAPNAPSVPPEDRAERRQVTVMFSDLVGSTALSARMDPEDLREVISAYQRCVAKTVRTFDGFVANYMGDGVLVYFGYPEAHEDDAERAVRAGLELVTAVGALKTHALLQTRIGIATGLVVVGDLIGSGEALESGIVGETPNLAARLQGVAEPNTVVIAESTRKLLGNLFEFENLGAKDLKGIAGAVRTWAVLRPSQAEGRFEALHPGGVTELVGREEELNLLLRRWSKAKAGEGQVVLLSGEAGIGKSRLTAALLEAIAPEPHSSLRHSCSQQRTDSALYPTIRHVERSAGFTLDDTTQTKLDKLDALLAQSSTSAHDAALFADMLSLPNDGRYPALELSPQQRRQQTLDLLVSRVAALSHQNPLLIIFEDAHWTDPTGLELFSRIIDKIPNLRVLLLITFRSEFEAPWVGQSHVTALTINRLPRREVEVMIDRVVGNKPLPASFRHDIIERTDGIPLFVEEMTKAVLEAGDEDATERAVAGPSRSVKVPASLHASLMARLDRLGSGKEVAQIGAVLGREFSYALLAAVAQNDETKLQSALEGLTSAGLLFRQGAPPHTTYFFKHALVQDAAYGTLLRERRRALHARIAEALETQFHETAESQPELVARHSTEAGLIEKAANFWAEAGRRSVARSALVEAIAQFTRALEQIATLPGTPAQRRKQIELQLALISPLIHVKGHSSPEVKAATERARLLIEQAETFGESPESPLLLHSVLYYSWVANVTALNGDALRTLAAQFLALAEKQGATVPLTMGHSLMGYSLLVTGNFAQSLKHYDSAIALYDPAVHRPRAMLFLSGDPRVVNLSSRSLTLWFLGYAEAALADTNHCLKDARDINQAGSLFYALNNATITHFLCGQYTTAESLANELCTLADEKGASMVWKSPGLLFRGWILAVVSRATEAVQLITSGLAALPAGATLLTPAGLSMLAKSHADLGQLDDAWRSIDEAKAVIEKTKETWFEAHVHRIAGEIALKSPEPDAAKAEAYFERALAVARQQQAKSWELRASISLSRLWRDQGKVQQACGLLAPVYGWFTEGFDTRDLKEAKVLLEELASGN